MPAAERCQQVPEAANDGKAFKERASVRIPTAACSPVKAVLASAALVLTSLRQHDVTGWSVWGSSVILARFLESRAGLLAGQEVLELGAGCGLSGLWAAAQRRGAPSRVWLTDFNEHTVANLRHNAAANAACCCPCEVSAMDWDEDETWPRAAGETRVFPVVIGADLVYRRSYARKLFSVVARLVAPGGVFVLATPGQREGLPTLVQALQRAGWACEEELDAPPEWRVSPLRADSTAEQPSGDEALHFPELAIKSVAYPLNVFVWRKGS